MSLGQLSLCATTTEAPSLQPVLHNKRSHLNEQPVHCNEEQSQLTATRENPRAATKTQCSHKCVNNFFFKRSQITLTPGSRDDYRHAQGRTISGVIRVTSDQSDI